MTPAEKAEWQYRHDERLALLGASPSPTPEQRDIAIREADQAIEKLRAAQTARNRKFLFNK